MQTTWKCLMGIMALAILLAVPALHAGAQDIPQSIEIDSLANLYEAVPFDHAMHIDLAEGCSSCHHQTTGTPMVDENCGRCHHEARSSGGAACGQCHAPDPFSAEYLRAKEVDLKRYHRDKPGLKAAYHLNCLGCHEENGGPTGCQDCHVRTDAGDAMFHAGAYAPNGETESAHH